MRLLLSLAFAVALAASAAAAEPAVPGAQPRNQTVLVNGGFIRLGDLFPEAGEKAAVVVAYAPAPGSRTVYDVNALVKIARANGVAWQPRSWFDRVVVERPAVTVGDAEITAAVRAELAKHHLDTKADIELATRGISLQLPADAPLDLELQGFKFDDRSGQFSGTLVLPAVDGQQTLAVTGRLYRTVEVPTLTRRIATGETVAKDDILWQPARLETLARNVILDPAKIVGMEAKHPLPADQPLRTGDVRAPLLVTKGTLVTMVVQSPSMTLTAKGRAMDSGALGESVKIQNTQSKIVVEGEVISPGTVRVASAAPVHF
ncbi:MAG: flagellar basal body P-ring formation chaperone FlgA [Gemmatimonas sp.]